MPRVTRQVSDRSNKGLRLPGSEPRPHSLLAWNLIFNTFKVSAKSKHNYIRSLALLMKSNRKIYCLSEASPEKLGNREKLWPSISEGGWGVHRGLWIIKSLPTQTDPHLEVQIQSIWHQSILCCSQSIWKFTLGWVSPEDSSCHWSAVHFFVWQPQHPGLRSFWSSSYRLLTGRFSSRSSKYTSLSNSHSMFITVGFYVDLFKTARGRNTYSLGRSSTVCSNASHLQ